MTRLDALSWFRRLAMAGIILLACVEVFLTVLTIWLTVWLWRVMPPDLRVFWLIVCTHPIVMIFFLRSLHALEYTTVEFDDTQMTLRHPCRQWTGPWRAVQRAYLFRGALRVQTTGDAWKTWYVKIDPRARPALDEFRRRLPPGAWLNEQAARWHHARRLAPVMLLAAALAAIIIYLFNQTLSEFARIPFP